MITTHLSAGKAISRALLIAGATGSLAVVLGGPASAAPLSPSVTEKSLGVDACSSTGQMCPDISSAGVSTKDEVVIIEFTASPQHCSDIVAHVLIDGREVTANRLGPGESDNGNAFRVGAGGHQIGVRADGVLGGCNTGSLTSWKGTLRVERIGG